MNLQNASGAPIELGTLSYLAAPLPEERANEVVELAASSGALFTREGSSLAALGTAARVSFPNGIGHDDARALQAMLAGIPEFASLGEHALRPVVLGALPFDTSAPASMLLPELAVMTSPKGPARLVAIGTPARLSQLQAEFPLGDVAPPSIDRPALPNGFDLLSRLSHEDFKARIAKALVAIDTGQLKKVVLAREVLVQANRPFVMRDLIGRLRALYPSCATFSIDGFIGASPELLCRREDKILHSQPLAGTTPRSGDPEEDARLAARLFSSAKERAEHRYVVEQIAESLDPYVSAIDVPDEPHLLELRNVVHLATMIRAELATDPSSRQVPGALSMALALHPTPAVGGVPRDEALKWLKENEGLERDLYAGPVGYMQANGDGEFYVGIRSAMIDGANARLIAGVGIVKGSDPDEELAETQLKLQALLSAAVRP